jgi:molybdenum cofactor biosynthesis protein B
VSYAGHQHAAEGESPRCAIVTLSDTRTPETDTSGKMIADLLNSAGFSTAVQVLIPDEPTTLQKRMADLLAREDIDVVLTNGGTGISRRDQTIGVIEKLIETPLPGFGELFRMLSWEQIGSGSMLSRAVGGVANGKLIFSMPGSSKAVELAMTKLILPELKHLVHELKR